MWPVGVTEQQKGNKMEKEQGIWEKCTECNGTGKIYNSIPGCVCMYTDVTGILNGDEHFGNCPWADKTNPSGKYFFRQRK